MILLRAQEHLGQFGIQVQLAGGETWDWLSVGYPPEPFLIPSAAQAQARLPEARQFVTASFAEHAGVCLVCGCEEARACLGPGRRPCHWVEPGLCSSCASPFPRADA